MQPIYCTWNANGKVAHTPGLRTRVTNARGWVNSALGELATVSVSASDDAARNQRWAACEVNVPKDCDVEWDPQARVLSIRRKAEEEVR